MELANVNKERLKLQNFLLSQKKSNKGVLMDFINKNNFEIDKNPSHNNGGNILNETKIDKNEEIKSLMEYIQNNIRNND